MKLENLPNDVLRQIARRISGKNIGRLNVALVGSTRARNVIRPYVTKQKEIVRKMANKKIIRKFKRAQNTNFYASYNSNHNLNNIAPVYKNTQWKYYSIIPFERGNINLPHAIFYNAKNGPAYIISNTTGKRRPAPSRIKRAFSGATKDKRTPNQTWNAFKKRAQKFINNERNYRIATAGRNY